MNIHFSSATVQSYENKDTNMDLFYNPIVIFEETDYATIEQLEEVKFVLSSDKIGTHQFDIQDITKASIEEIENKVFIEFRLHKKDVLFQYDNYLCKITFFAMSEKSPVEHSVVGVVKTKWSKGLL